MKKQRERGRDKKTQRQKDAETQGQRNERPLSIIRAKLRA